MLLIELVTGRIIKEVENMNVKEMMSTEKETGYRFMSKHNYNVYIFGLTRQSQYLN